MTTSVASLLQGKGSQVVTVLPETPVSALVRLLAERRIGAAPVVDAAGTVVGIVSERDVVRGLAGDTHILDHPVSRLMTSDVRTCGLNDTVLEVMEIMTAGRFRHLPVVENGRLAGIVSIGDVVKQRIEEAQFEVDALKSYIVS
ncbi:MAG TPA: CBS domain-containing protein [Stellaceae bacterium]|nr:CBS domain-containing protein [Stellaceae bacterium]